MQSALILVAMVLASIFISSELQRNRPIDYVMIKSDNVAANILQYNDLVAQYVRDKYDELYVPLSTETKSVLEIHLLDYENDKINKYSQKNFERLFDYKSVVFNYAKFASGESNNSPLLYLVSSWESNAYGQIHGYSQVRLPEVMGILGEDLAKRIYQGNSTYWIVPWVFSQHDCDINEIFSQLPNDALDMPSIDKLKTLFKLLCTDIERSSEYKFLTYVYMTPIIKLSNF